MLLAAFGVSESCVVHTPWWFTAHWFHSNDWPFCESQRTIHCPWDHLQLACMCHHSKLHQLSIYINSFSIHKIHRVLQCIWPNQKELVLKKCWFYNNWWCLFSSVKVIFYLKRGNKTEKKKNHIGCVRKLGYVASSCTVSECA